MNPKVLPLLICPACQSSLEIEQPPVDGGDDSTLVCTSCGHTYPIVRDIARFEGLDSTYVDNFGAQWQKFSTTQIDRLAGHTLSADRLLGDTQWAPEWFRGKLILDAGCGAGRFTDVMADLGADVVAVDLSEAVEACRTTAADVDHAAPDRGCVTVIQANLLSLPFAEKSFDAVHCAGVLQHTPDPEAIIQDLTRLVKPGGRIFLNFYEVTPATKFQVIKYTLRRWTPKWSEASLNRFCLWLCRVFFIPSFVLSKIPILRQLNRVLPIAPVLPAGTSLRQKFQLTLLETIDWYGPVFETRLRHSRVGEILGGAGLSEVRSDHGRAWAVRD